MSEYDRWWIAVCALGAVGVAGAEGLGQFVSMVIWGALLALIAILESRKRKASAPDKTVLPKVPTSPAVAPLLPEPSPADAVRAQLEAYQVAGFSETQAQELVQEAMRTQIKQAGGWSA